MNNSKFWNSNSTIQPNKRFNGPKTSSKRMKDLGTAGVIFLLFLLALGLTLYATIISPAMAVSAKAKVLKADGNKIVGALQSRDLVALDEAINKFNTDLKALKEERDRRFGWASKVKMFKANEFYSDTDHFINAGFYSMEALKEVEKVAIPFADAAGLKVTSDQKVPEQKGLMEAFQSWITIMPQVAGQMDGVISKVAKVGDEFEQVDTNKYPETFFGIEIKSNLDFVKKSLANVNEYGPDIKQALTVFPKVLAVGTTEKRYMIIMQNDKELRPTGGFMTNYATFKINNGLLQSDFTSKDMYSIDRTLDAIDATYDFPDPPAAYIKYLKVERWYARDMNYSPDFITSMDQFLKFYNMAGRLNPFEIKPVDGVVGIDTRVIQELLDVTGPVTVSGITYSKDNVVLELEKIASLELREQANRKKVLGDLMEAMLVNVFQSDKNLWPKLIDRGVSLALRKHIVIYIFDPDAQALVEKYNFAGRLIPDTAGDYSMIVSTNLGGDKTNWFTTKKVTHSLSRDNDKWLRTVKIEYSYPQPEAQYGPFVKRFKDWVRVYAPAGSQFVNVEGSEDGTSTDQELNKTFFTGYIELAPGESKTMTFKYYLPAGKVNGDSYSLAIQKQPGIDSETHIVNVSGKTQEVTLDKDTLINFKIK
jgi:hypothetical protein